MDDLPTYFDVIVVGTGMPECIVAAAAARIGKKVLHIDRNNYYGGDWASFSFDKFLDWINETKENNEHSEELNNTDSTFAHLLKEEETLVLCPPFCKSIFNLHSQSHIRDSPEEAISPNAASNADTSSSAHENDTTENDVASTQNDNAEAGTSNETTGAEENAENQSSNVENASVAEPSQLPVIPNTHQEWTLATFMENRRKFNIDLSPKIMFSRGSLVELLISSNIARYAEFQCINRVLTYNNGHIEQVPCSRADVFSTKNVSVVEKRMLMKFLTFCLKFDEQEEEYKEFEDKLFIDFLRSKKLTPNVEHYIIHAIAMVSDTCNTIEGLKATQKFLQSLGRYGNSPFLCTCYGSAELPQCFCRLCAVYEGMYYLKRKPEAIIMKNNRCCGTVSLGQRIDCEFLIMESSYAAQEFYSTDSLQSLSRAVLITDASLCPSEKKENTLLRFPPSDGMKNPVTILELSSKNYVCPEDLYIVYMYCRSSGQTAEEDLDPIINLLFKREDSGESEESKPNLLWSVFFNQRDTSTINLNSHTPEGLFLTSSPDIELDYEHAVKEAQTIFETMYPGEEFLPRAPDPEDILIKSHNNPGDEENVGKIENDVSDSEENKENEVGGDENKENEVEGDENKENDNSAQSENQYVQENEDDV